MREVKGENVDYDYKYRLRCDSKRNRARLFISAFARRMGQRQIDKKGGSLLSKQKFYVMSLSF